MGKKDRRQNKARASKSVATDAQREAKRRKKAAREGVDPDMPPPLAEDQLTLTWPRVAWRDHPVRHLANWPEGALLDRLKAFGFDVSRERFEEYSAGGIGVEHLVKSWQARAHSRGDHWDTFPEAALSSLWHRWQPDTPFIEDLSLRLLESSYAGWVRDELSHEAALFLVRWLQEAAKLLARMPEGDPRFDAWVAIEDVADYRLGLFIPDHWEQLVKADLDAMLEMRLLLGDAVEEPEWLYLFLAKGLLEKDRAGEVLPLLEEGVDPDWMPSATYFGHAGEILLSMGRASDAEAFLKRGLPHILTGTQWDLITEHLKRAFEAQGKSGKLTALLKKHPRPDLDEEDDEYQVPADELDDADIERLRSYSEDPPPETPQAVGPVSDHYRGVGRNDSCPCGSGKKFKKCHGVEA